VTLEAFVAGGTSEVSAARAFLTVAVYVAVAAALAGTIFARRDRSTSSTGLRSGGC
jgi:hypothetical protein